MGLSFQDLLSGGAHNQGDPSSDGAGDGAKGNAITGYLSAITGAYNAITGGGGTGSPAPAAQVAKPAGINYALYGGIAVGAVLLLWLVMRRK